MLEIQKADLRKNMRGKLKALAADRKKKGDLDRLLGERVLEFLDGFPESLIFGYAPLTWEAGELGLLDDILSSGRRLALPRVEGSSMEFFEIASLSELAEGTFHVKEPKPYCLPVSEEKMPGILLAPGLAFTRGGLRLGKGGGYYDRFLSKNPGYKTAALAYGFQVVQELPAGPRDKSVDFVITPEGVWKTKDETTV